MSTKTPVRCRLVLWIVAVLLAVDPDGAASAAERLKVCTFRFQGPEEVGAFWSRLPAADFEFLDLSPPPLLAGAQGVSATTLEPAVPGGWFDRVCRRDLQCDVVVLSAEFGGRFFGKSARALTLQEMEEASCQARCDGLFHAPREVFLLACNTLATKDVDMRGPAVYLQVLLDHGFDQASAERVVALRYGPLGPTFREALRRVFAGVPRVYGFSSAAPRGEYTGPMLEKYFRSVGDYRRHLDQVLRDQASRNDALLAAFAGTGLVETSGLSASEPAAHDRDLICALYDEHRPVVERLEIVRSLAERSDILAFIPSIQVFMDRHRPDRMKGEERQIFDEVRRNDAARERVRALIHQLDVSALQLELAHFAVHMGWMTSGEFSTLAIDAARQLLHRPITNDVVDVMCELPKHEQVGDHFASGDLPESLFLEPEGIRMVSCLAPPGAAVSERIATALSSSDPDLRLWAAHALTRRLPLPEGVLLTIVAHLNDPSPDVVERLRWVFKAQQPLPRDVTRALEAKDPRLAAELRPGPRR